MIHTDYLLETQIINNRTNYYVRFFNGTNYLREEVTEEIYNALLESQRINIRLLRWDERHREQMDLTDEMLYIRTQSTPDNTENIVMDKLAMESLWNAISRLSKVQKKRLLLYYMWNYTYEQIASVENCSVTAVSKSIKSALKKLKNILSDRV